MAFPKHNPLKKKKSGTMLARGKRNIFISDQKSSGTMLARGKRNTFISDQKSSGTMLARGKRNTFISDQKSSGTMLAQPYIHPAKREKRLVGGTVVFEVW